MKPEPAALRRPKRLVAALLLSSAALTAAQQPAPSPDDDPPLAFITVQGDKFVDGSTCKEFVFSGASTAPRCRFTVGDNTRPAVVISLLGPASGDGVALPGRPQCKA